MHLVNAITNMKLPNYQLFNTGSQFALGLRVGVCGWVCVWMGCVGCGGVFSLKLSSGI